MRASKGARGFLLRKCQRLRLRKIWKEHIGDEVIDTVLIADQQQYLAARGGLAGWLERQGPPGIWRGKAGTDQGTTILDRGRGNSRRLALKTAVDAMPRQPWIRPRLLLERPMVK